MHPRRPATHMKILPLHPKPKKRTTSRHQPLKMILGLQPEELLARTGSRSPGHRNRLRDEVEDGIEIKIVDLYLVGRLHAPLEGFRLD